MATKKGKSGDSSSNVQKHLDDIQKDLKELRGKIGMPKKADFNKLSHDAAKSVSDTASEIIKTSSELLERAIKVVQYSAAGALEGGRKALHEQEKTVKRSTAKKSSPRSKSTGKSSSAKRSSGSSKSKKTASKKSTASKSENK